MTRPEPSALLAEKKCAPCEGKSAPLAADQSRDFLRQLPGWRLDENVRVLIKDFEMKNFSAAVEFIRRIAALAEAEGHHPDLHLTSYRRLRIELTTHAIRGLSENDFILAAKIEGVQR